MEKPVFEMLDSIKENLMERMEKQVRLMINLSQNKEQVRKY